jgi:hypothetical protein
MLGGSSDGGLINAMIWLVGLGLIFWLLWWLIDYVKIPEPFSKVARVILAVIAVVLLIRLIMRVTGSSF